MISSLLSLLHHPPHHHFPSDIETTLTFHWFLGCLSDNRTYSVVTEALHSLLFASLGCKGSVFSHERLISLDFFSKQFLWEQSSKKMEERKFKGDFKRSSSRNRVIPSKTWVKRYANSSVKSCELKLRSLLVYRVLLRHRVLFTRILVTTISSLSCSRRRLLFKRDIPCQRIFAMESLEDEVDLLLLYCLFDRVFFFFFALQDPPKMPWEYSREEDDGIGTFVFGSKGLKERQKRRVRPLGMEYKTEGLDTDSVTQEGFCKRQYTHDWTSSERNSPAKESIKILNRD